LSLEQPFSALVLLLLKPLP